MVATSLVEMDRSADFTYSDSTNPLSSCPSSGIYAKTISRSNRNFWKKFDEENSSRKLRAPVTSTSARETKFSARGGPTHRRAFPCLPQRETTVHRRQSIAANVATGVELRSDWIRTSDLLNPI